MFHKIKSVRALPDFKILVHFCEGVAKEYNLHSLFEKWPSFIELKNDPTLFEGVHVDIGGYGIIWNDELDLSCDELYHNGITVPTPFDGIIAFGDATEIWGLNESTLRKAISYGRLVVGIDVCKYGKQWVITADSMRRLYGEPKRYDLHI
ncbi:MAG: DUF2442 domain-containing protein [Mogibacterium sp.]|nr:DUF2442 domain-containing protein [Mogibacterium sp.]